MQIKVVTLSCLVILSSNIYADVITDSKVQLDFRNLYMVRDPETKPVPAFEHWSQSATLNIQSGYQNLGAVSVGLDTNLAYAHRLLEDQFKRDGTMPNDPVTGTQLDDQTHLGLTFKAKVADTDIRYGQLMPKLPVLHIDHSRNLPTSFKGLLIESKDIEKTKITVGRVTHILARDKEDYERFTLDVNKTGKYSDGMNIVGVDYKVLPNLDVSYFYGGLDDIYDQHYVGLKHKHEFNEKINLSTDLRVFDTQDAGDQLQGKIDNKAYNFMSLLQYGNHKFGLGYQHMSGDTAFPLLSGWTPAPFLTQWGSISFYKAGERSVQLRYDYDFKGLGIDGLYFMTRYIAADHIRHDKIKDVEESEFNIVMNYAIRDGKWKGLGFQYMLIKTDFEGAGIKLDEHRFYTNYTFKF